MAYQWYDIIGTVWLRICLIFIILNQWLISMYHIIWGIQESSVLSNLDPWPLGLYDIGYISQPRNRQQPQLLVKLAVTRVRNNHYFWDIMVGYGYGYRIFMVGYGYGYITIITIITILTNNRITILKMVKMVMYLQKNDLFFQKDEKCKISGWIWSVLIWKWLRNDMNRPWWSLNLHLWKTTINDQKLL